VVETKTSQLPLRQQTAPNASSNLLSAFSATNLEWQSFDFYLKTLAVALSGVMDSDIWQNLVVQVGSAEPAIRHGMCALGSIFRHSARESKGPTVECGCLNCRQALRSYNKSISCLTDRLERDDPSVVALVSCAIYICIEMYRDNDDAALGLVAKGCEILSNLARRNRTERGPMAEFRLVSLFVRLQLLSAMCGQPVPLPISELDYPSATPWLIDTIQGARAILFSIMRETQSFRLRCFQIESEVVAGKNGPEIINSLLAEQESLQLKLDAWYGAFRRLLQHQPVSDGNKELAISMLHVYHAVAKIFTATGLGYSQDIYAAFDDDFRTIIRIIDSSLGVAQNGNESEVDFSFEMGFMPPLYLAALKCRDSALRRKALSLMALTKDKEGTWGRRECMCVASRVINLEEGTSDLQLPDHVEERATPLLFHDVLIHHRHQSGDTSFVDVIYVWRSPTPGETWKTMQETLTI